MPKFKPYNQNQSMLLPPDLKDWLPHDHICFVLNQIVDSLDIAMIEQTYSDQGASAYHPRSMIKTIFYSYTKGIRSSRKIEALATEDIVVRYLSANAKPDHGTISLFRQTHLKSLEDLFAQIVILCDGLGLVDVSDISIDGSIFKANASKRSTLNKQSIAKLKQKIGEILAEAEQVDQAEDQTCGNRRGYHQMPDKLLDPATRQAEIDRLKAKLLKLEQADASIDEKQAKAQSKEDRELKRNSTHNITDNDANLMKMKNTKSHYPGFNGQIATSHQFILAYDIFDNGTDTPALLPMIEKTKANTNQPVAVVKADSSYFSKENIKGINGQGINGYIPDREKEIEEKQNREQSIPAYDKRNFTYDQALDRYQCPQGKYLNLSALTKLGKRKYMCHDCPTCSMKSQCIKGKHRYLVVDRETEQYKTDMRAKLNTDQGKQKYLERMSDVEPPFNNIKYNLNAGQFLCRGKPKVKIEFGLTCLAHNLTKIANWVKKNKEKWEKIQLATLIRLEATA